jgi:IS1 family transposase
MWGNVHGAVEIACTDGNPSYRELFEYDIDTRHVVSKAETCLVESKSLEMLRLSVLLVLY